MVSNLRLSTILYLSISTPADRKYRRDCLTQLPQYIPKEFDFMDGFAQDNPKNYQLWHHRRAIVEFSKDPSRELEFCGRVFEVDAKNYHAWSHR
jgi:protein farnesyltransferase/geranylgeranyltransferase type-1 subunit alpha